MSTRQRLATVVVCLLLSVSLAGVGGAAVGPTPTQVGSLDALASAGQPVIDVTYRVSLTPGEPGAVMVTYTVDLPDSVGEYTVAPPSAVTAASGFTDNGNGSWSWDGQTVAPTLTYDVTVGGPDSVGQSNVDVGEWAFVARTALFAQSGWRYSGTAPEYRSTLAVDGEGYAADEFAYLGAYTEHHRSGSQSFVLVEATAATPTADPTTVLAALDSVGEGLDVDQRDGEVTVFVVPDPIRGGGAASDSSFWVNERTQLSTTASTYYHEYIHTRQNFDYVGSEEMYWFVEASADYYAGYLTWEAGGTSTSAFRDYVATSLGESDVLIDARPDADPVEYTKGRRVLAALDLKIRAETDGERTLEDVFRRLNGEAPSYGGFQDAVEAVAGSNLDGWLDQYVTTSDAPPIPADLDAAYAPGEPPNTAPVADAGVDQAVDEGVSVTLDGSGSTDPDGDQLDYTWTQTSGPSVVLQGGETAPTSFTTPTVSATTTLTFELLVTDGTASDTDTVTVTVEPTGPVDDGSGAPGIDDALSLAGRDGDAAPGGTAIVSFTVTNTGTTPTGALGLQVTTLPDGFAVSDITTPSGTASPNRATVFWTQPVSPDERVTATYTFSVPTDAEPGNYTVTALAQDGSGASTTTTVTVRVTEEPVDPVVVMAGSDGSYQFREVLDAIASFNDQQVVPGAGRPLTFQEVLRIIELFNEQ